jgi:hypothetical protein
MTNPGMDLDARLEEYLRIRRSLGYKLERDGKLLAQFIAWLHEQHADTVTVEHAVAWVSLPAAGTGWLRFRMSVVRGFAAYLHTLDPAVPVPPAVHSGRLRLTQPVRVACSRLLPELERSLSSWGSLGPAARAAGRAADADAPAVGLDHGLPNWLRRRRLHRGGIRSTACSLPPLATPGRRSWRTHLRQHGGSVIREAPARPRPGSQLKSNICNFMSDEVKSSGGIRSPRGDTEWQQQRQRGQRGMSGR